MLCAGLTVYSPLVRLGAGPGKKVAIVGLGGLGHFAVLWASALGAEVYVLSHSPNKKEDALKMGAKHFVVTSEKDWHKDLAFTFDFILNWSVLRSRHVYATCANSVCLQRRCHSQVQLERLLWHNEGYGTLPQRGFG